MLNFSAQTRTQIWENANYFRFLAFLETDNLKDKSRNIICIISDCKQNNSVGLKKPISAGYHYVYERARVCVYLHASRDMSDLSGTGTSQRTTVVEIQFSGGDRGASESVTE